LADIKEDLKEAITYKKKDAISRAMDMLNKQL